MKVSILGAAVFFAAGSAIAQPPAQPPRSDLSVMGDEFNATALDKKWTRYDQRYGWPDKLKRFDVGATTQGALHLEPFDSAWVRDRSAPFLLALKRPEEAGRWAASWRAFPTDWTRRPGNRDGRIGTSSRRASAWTGTRR